MTQIKPKPLIWTSFALALFFMGCSKDDNNTPEIPQEPSQPTESTVSLTQFEVILGDQTTSGTTDNRSFAASQPDLEGANLPKTAFVVGDCFTFSYSNSIQASQKAYAYTADGKTWTIHEKEDANSPAKTIQLEAKSPALGATYLSPAALNAGADKDGVVTQNGASNEMQVACFDALVATAEVAVSGDKATAKVPFTHVNHLLNLYVRGDIAETAIDYLELDLSYTNASGVQQNAVLITSSRASYAATNGTVYDVIQAIVPHDAVLKNIRAIKHDQSVITSETVGIECPGGKNRLVTLNTNGRVLSIQVGSLIDKWVFGGEMNPDGSPVGDIYINTADELRIFSAAVNTNPAKPAAKINGVLAYTAHVVQTADIDLSALAWRPIGGNTYDDDEGNTELTFFAGTYNGNGYKISGMRTTSSTASGHSIASYGGLFGNVQSPAGDGYTVLTNIRLVNVQIELNEAIDYSYAGALAGLVYTTREKNPVIISQCSAQGAITVTNNSGWVAVGGLVGEASRTHITNSNTDVSVAANTSAYLNIGGVAGRILNASIVSSYATGSVVAQSSNGTALAGGIVGSLSAPDEFSYILACSSSGDVTSTGKEANAGGVAGYNAGNIVGCYAKGNVASTSPNSKVGAIVGLGAQVHLSYGVGAVGVGSSNVPPSVDNIAYKVDPIAGDILSIVSGRAWKEAHGTEMAEATVGGILTTIPVTIDGKLMQAVKSRLWVLSDPDVWTVSSPATNLYPLPANNYKGE